MARNKNNKKKRDTRYSKSRAVKESARKAERFFQVRLTSPSWRKTGRTFGRTNLQPSLVVSPEHAERKSSYGETLRRFGSLPTITDQILSRSSSRKQRDGSFRSKSYPKAIDDYVDNMGDVDTANQLRSYYERDRKANKWWHRLLYSLLETCLVNSWIYFNDMMSSQMAETRLFIRTLISFFFTRVEEKHPVNFENPMTLLEFKNNVTMGLLTDAINAKKQLAGRAGRMIPTIHPSTEPGAKRRKNRLSVRDDISFSAVGLHLPIFEEARGRCEWCQATTERRKESRPFVPVITTKDPETNNRLLLSL